MVGHGWLAPPPFRSQRAALEDSLCLGPCKWRLAAAHRRRRHLCIDRSASAAGAKELRPHDLFQRHFTVHDAHDLGGQVVSIHRQPALSMKNTLQDASGVLLDTIPLGISL